MKGTGLGDTKQIFKTWYFGKVVGGKIKRVKRSRILEDTERKA